MLISNNGGYKLFCETKLYEFPSSSEKLVTVHLYSEYELAKNPTERHTKLNINLTPEEFKNFINALTKNSL